MATLDASEVLARLKELGHDHNPDKIRYKTTELAGNTVVLYDLNRQRVELRAEGIEGYVAKGFTTSMPESIEEIAEAVEPPAPPAPTPITAAKKAPARGKKATAAEPPAPENPNPAAPENPDGE